MILAGQTESRTIQCSHPDYPDYKYDFSDLWSGMPEKSTGTGAHLYRGGARGRPDLADDLWLPLNDFLQGKKPFDFRNAMAALRSFWRFLDAYETRGQGKVESVSDINASHSVLWISPLDSAYEPAGHQAYVILTQLLARARTDKFGPDDLFHWMPYPRKGNISEANIPTTTEIKTAIKLLKDRAREIFSRWERADQLAANGRNFLDLPRQHGDFQSSFESKMTEADAHATYRAIVEETGNPVPTKAEFLTALGLSDRWAGNYPSWWPRNPEGHPRAGRRISIGELLAGLYPTSADLYGLFILFLARTGWNPATAERLDISNPRWAIEHGKTASSVLWLIRAFKNRSEEWQTTVALEKTTTGAHYIIRKLLERSQALRALIEKDPTRCKIPSVALRTPWLAVASPSCSNSVVCLTGNYSAVFTWWKKSLTAHNKSAPAEKRIPANLQISDWRDIFASHVFEDSRYSWLLLKWALGHKHLSSTRHYLRNRLWRQYSEQKLNRVVTVVIDEIEVTKRLDLAVVRARVDFDYEPTSQDRERLENARQTARENDLTYSGFLCDDRTHPPPEIDPGNPSDGTMPCRRGERCISCPIGQAIDAFHLCKRRAELEHIQKQVTAVVWAESDYPADLDALKASLKQWPDDEVNGHIDYWTEEISAGRHRPIRFGAKR